MRCWIDGAAPRYPNMCMSTSGAPVRSVWAAWQLAQSIVVASWSAGASIRAAAAARARRRSSTGARVGEGANAALSGRDGALLPPELYARACGAPGTLMLGGTPAAPALAGLRVVALRLDPCFGPACQPQLRLVFQTLRFADGTAVAVDDAVHAFYAVEPGELAAMVRAVAALHHRPLGPLAPHPLLVAQGLRGELGTALADLVRRHAGARNLVRLTVLTSSGLGTAWNFAGVDLAGGVATPIAIPRLPGARVEGFFAGFTPRVVEATFAPAPTLAPADDLRLARAAATRIEAPHLHDASTIDCASCHAAQTLRTGATEVDMHMFGYRGATPSIQQRTNNEVAASLAYLRAHP